MKVIIQGDIDSTNKETDITLTSEQIDNENFVDMVIGEETHTISVEDLYDAMKLFMERKAREEDCMGELNKETIRDEAIEKFREAHIERCQREDEQREQFQQECKKKNAKEVQEDIKKKIDDRHK